MSKKDNAPNENAAPQQTPTPEATAKKRRGSRASKRTITIYIDPDLYETVQTLARYRAAQGQRNEQGQPMSAAGVIGEAVKEYLERHQGELDKWKEFLGALEGL